MANRYFISKRIGDGDTLDTAFRPAIAENSENWRAMELLDRFFLVAVLDDAEPAAGDIQVPEGQLEQLVAERAPQFAGKRIRLGGHTINVNPTVVTP